LDCDRGQTAPSTIWACGRLRARAAVSRDCVLHIVRGMHVASSVREQVRASVGTTTNKMGHAQTTITQYDTRFVNHINNINTRDNQTKQ
jgi:hypothetical protein